MAWRVRELPLVVILWIAALDDNGGGVSWVDATAGRRGASCRSQPPRCKQRHLAQTEIYATFHYFHAHCKYVNK